MKYLLKKASKYRFGNSSGECFLMTMCLTKYMKEEKGITLQTHVGGIQNENDKNDLVVHLWNSYKGKMIDLTSHTQPELRVKGEILGKKIKGFENSKRVSNKTMDTPILINYAKDWIIDRSKIDKNDITIDHIFVDNVKTGLVSYETLQNALDYKIARTQSPFLYQDFYDYMSNASS